MRNTNNLGLVLYDASDKMNITSSENSLNHNMELLDAELAKKMAAPENGTTGQVLTKTEGGFAWQDALAGVAKAYKLPVIDNYTGLGVNRFNREIYLGDGSHHTQAGRELLADHITHAMW